MLGLRLGKYPAGGTMQAHHHGESHFTVVLAGSYRERIRGRHTEHRPGCMLFYPAGEMHSQDFGQIGSESLIFRPKPSWVNMLSGKAVSLEEAPFVSSDHICHLAKRLLQETKNHDAFSQVIMEGILLELVAIFGRSYGEALRPSVPSSWVKQCREMLEMHNGSALTHEELAGYVGRHPVHVARAFRKAYGETIGDFQRRLRLNRAEMLLRNNHVPLAEIALACGFANQAHLSRCFRAAFGTTPSKYRADYS